MHTKTKSVEKWVCVLPICSVYVHVQYNMYISNRYHSAWGSRGSDFSNGYDGGSKWKWRKQIKSLHNTLWISLLDQCFVICSSDSKMSIHVQIGWFKNWDRQLIFNRVLQNHKTFFVFNLPLVLCVGQLDLRWYIYFKNISWKTIIAFL